MKVLTLLVSIGNSIGPIYSNVMNGLQNEMDLGLMSNPLKSELSHPTDSIRLLSIRGITEKDKMHEAILLVHLLLRR